MSFISFIDIHETTGPGTDVFLPTDVINRHGGFAVGAVSSAFTGGLSPPPPRRAATWSIGGGATLLNVPDSAEESIALGVNDFGDIAGVYAEQASSSGVVPRHGFFQHRGSLVDLGPMLGTPFSFASDINNNRMSVGGAGNGVDACDYELFVCDAASGHLTRNLGKVCFVPRPAQAFSRREHLSGPCINNSDQIVGLYAPGTDGYQLGLYQNGTVVSLGDVEGVCDINNGGIVVGSQSYSPNFSTASFIGNKNILGRSPSHGFAYDLNAANPCFEVGMPKDSRTPSRLAYAQGIDDHGNIVGYTMWDVHGTHGMAPPQVGPGPSPPGIPYGAFLYNTSSGVVWLNDLLSGLPSGAGWDLIEAVEINNGPVVVGYGKHHGRDCSFLLEAYWSAT